MASLIRNRAKLRLPMALGAVLIAVCATTLHSVADTPRTQAPSESETPLTFPQAMDVLYRWLGPWTVVERHFDESGRVVAETTATEEGRWAIEERAIRRIYRNANPGVAAFVAEGTFTYNELNHTFEGFWIHNQSTHGPSTSRARWSDGSKTMIYDVEQAVTANQRDRFRVVERFLNDRRREATTYRARGNEWVKMIEMVYERSGPCPERQSTLRIILDGIP